MREIKFRAWDTYTNKIIFKFTLGSDTKMGSDLWTCPLTLRDEGTLTQEWVNNDCLELMQYTGLKDKNGVEIYEGDIVRVLYTDWMSQHLGTEEQRAMTLQEYLNSIAKIDEVVYKNLSFTLSNGSIFCGKHGFIEVIGNIYENPELLE